MPVAIDRTSDDQEVDPWGPWYLANADVLSGGEPSHSIVGSAADVAMFFQALCHSGLWDAGHRRRRDHARVSQPPFGEQLYGGSPEVANIGLFCSVSGEYGGDWTPRTGRRAPSATAAHPAKWGSWTPRRARRSRS